MPDGALVIAGQCPGKSAGTRCGVPLLAGEEKCVECEAEHGRCDECGAVLPYAVATPLCDRCLARVQVEARHG